MKKFLTLLLVIFSICSFFTRPVEADVGPKPSVKINVVNAPESSYYLVLLSDKDSYGPWAKIEDVNDNISDENEKEAYAFFVSYKDSDGFNFIGNMSNDLKGIDEYSWNYYPPETFKVAIYVPEDGSFYLSSEVTREAFYSYYTVDCSKVSLDIKEDVRVADVLLNLLFRIVLTILCEVLIALLFGYRNKKELTLIIIVNIITQIVLNVIMSFFDYYGGMMLWLILLPVGELIVIIIEEIVYLIGLKSHSKWRAFFYCLLANLLSCSLTFAGLFVGAAVH